MDKKITITNARLFKLRQGLDDLKIRGTDLAYAVSNNKAILDNEIAIIQDAMRTAIHPDRSKYDQELNKTAEKYAIRDDDDNIIRKDGLMEIPSSKLAAYKGEIDELENAFADVVKEAKEVANHNIEINNKEREITLYGVNKSDLPSDLTDDQMDRIFLFVINDKDTNKEDK